MLEEIRQQPQVLSRLLREERGKLQRLGEALRKRSIRLIILVARGSSDNAALFGRYLLEIATGIPVALAAPSIYTLYGAKMRLEHALVVGVSQSGEGEDINHVLTEARSFGAFMIGITNEENSSMVRLVDETLLVHGGRERSVAATKTFTGQMMMFYLLTEALTGGSSLIRGYERIPEFCEAALQHEAAVRELAQRYTFMENCVVLGRGLLYGNAYELALKLMETCYVVAERFSTADFFHGPLAMVERHFPVILFASPGPMVPGVKTMASRLRDLHAETLAITSDDELATTCSRAVRMTPEMSEFLSPIPYIIPGQLFAALLAESKGLDPDMPRSLSKVTRTL
jgi:glucosamine--fructose-6-phosphate aminotransferase (isomerizing)